MHAEFASDPSISFLNAGTLSRTPLSVLRWMREQRDLAEKNPTKAMFLSYPAIWETQKELAQFLGAAPGDLFLRPNITAAFNDFLFALPLNRGQEILLTSLEYGGISELARWRARQSGLGFRQIPLPTGPGVTDAQLVAGCVEAFQPETKVLIVSHVATATGAILPITAISAEAKKRDIVVLVDGAHAVGALPLVLGPQDNIDFYGGNFHKWFMGPVGTAFGWVHPRWKEKLDWKFGGWASFGKPSFYGTFGGGDEEACRRLMPGTIDPVPFLALSRVLDFWHEKGPAFLRELQGRRRDLVALHARRIGLERITPENAGPLVSYKMPAIWGKVGGPDLATRIYKETAVQLALTNVGQEQLVRFSPGVFTPEKEIAEGFERLSGFRA